MNEPWKEENKKVSGKDDDPAQSNTSSNDEEPICRIYWKVCRRFN